MSFKIDFTNCEKFVNHSEFKKYKEDAKRALQALLSGSGAGSSETKWLTLPRDFAPDELLKIKRCAESVNKTSDAFIVVGIGGSYAGARGGVDFILGRNNNLLNSAAPRLYFSGCDISGQSMQDLIDMIIDLDFSINVVSKSGTTTEPAIAFRILKELLIKRYGEKGADARIFATTDPQSGSLREMARVKGWETFAVPSGVGGRYSVLSAVGLFPLAVLGIDIDAVLEGARHAYLYCSEPDFSKNSCLRYAAIRNYFYRNGRCIEVFSSFEPDMHSFGEWLKQLFAESEGKGGHGLLPVFQTFSTDLHSIGQYVQDGPRNMFETFLWAKEPRKTIKVPPSKDNLDGLDYLENVCLHDINENALYAAAGAHADGNVPNLTISIPRMDAFNFGFLTYFFQTACALSGYILGVNPFDQPGVEAYKQNMFRLLNKPGYEP